MSQPNVNNAKGQVNPTPSPQPKEHEGATEEKVGNTGGPGAGYNDEPKQERDKGGVARS